MELKLIRSYSIDYTILKHEIVVIYRHNFLYLLRQYLETLNTAMNNVLRMERYNFFAHAPYGSVEKCWKAWAMSPVLAVSPTRAFHFFFFHFTTLGEEILGRVRSSTTFVNAEYLPKQLSV